MTERDFVNEYNKNYDALKSFLLDNVVIPENGGESFLNELNNLIAEIGAKNIFVVSGLPLKYLSVKDAFDKANGSFTYFTDFSPNPKFEEIQLGVDEIEKTGADLIIGIGGGSAIDTAKCIRYFSGKKVPLLAIPTTAGTGSEATKFAVYYKTGVKQSLEDEGVLPDQVFLCGDLIKTLPPYQRKCTFLDAFCQACESSFGRRRSAESCEVSFAVIRAMSLVKDFYPAGKGFPVSERAASGLPSIFEYALLCSYCSGRSINFTRTAAPHAMSYKLSSLRNIPHGHAVAVCFRVCFEKMADIYFGQDDPDREVSGILEKISDLSFGTDPSGFSGAWREYLDSIGINEPEVSDEEVMILAESVNAQRLANNPVIFDHGQLVEMYGRLGK